MTGINYKSIESNINLEKIIQCISPALINHGYVRQRLCIEIAQAENSVQFAMLGSRYPTAVSKTLLPFSHALFLLLLSASVALHY